MDGGKLYRVGILTVSDRCSGGSATDTSGDNLESMINSHNIVAASVINRECIPDEQDQIENILRRWSDSGQTDLILTTGGTGFAPRDVTPEATRNVIDKEAPGMMMAMLKGSLDVTPLAMLSRLVCGIRKQTLIINLPGSKKASTECLQFVSASLPHALHLLTGDTERVDAVHHRLNQHCHHHNKSHVDIRVARRDRESPYPIIPVEKAVDIVLSHSNIIGTEEVDFRSCIGRVLCQDVFAHDPLPPFPASMKDGYAVRTHEGVGIKRVYFDSTAGTQPTPNEILAGTCVRISTGAPVPPGCDAVVQVEDTVLIEEGDDGRTELQVEICKQPIVGMDIRPVGCDIAEGEKVLVKGTVLGPAEVSLLASVGVTTVKVFRPPTVSLLSTGNELQEPTSDLTSGHIRDSNKSLLQSLLCEHGISTVDVGIARDTATSLLTKVCEGLSAGDILVTTGGVSMGERDLLKDVLIEDLGADVHFGRVFMKPGKPVKFATCEYDGQKKLIFGLPGNPVSAAVTSHLYVVPSCRKIMGHPQPLHTVIQAKVDSTLKLDERPEYHRAILSWAPGEALPTAISTGNQLSSRLLSLRRSNALLVLPPRTDNMCSLETGSIVDAIVIARI